MKITTKYGFTAADALRLMREAKNIQIFLGEDGDRYLLNVPKAAITRELKAVRSDRSRLCYLDVSTRIIYFNSFKAKHHADRVRRRSSAGASL